MFTPAAKRRRVDVANETLRKPFKSPMVRDREAGPDTAAEDGAAPSPPPKPNWETRADSDSGAGPGSTTAASVATRPRPVGLQAVTPAKQMGAPSRRPFITSGASPSPTRGVLHGTGSVAKGGASMPGSSKVTREAEGREEIIRQAGRIRSAGEGETDEELVGLIEKWRAAGRIAAEEVFEGSRERVEGMGGLKGMRKAQREDGVRFAKRMREEEKHDEERRRGRVDADGYVEEEGEREQSPRELRVNDDGGEVCEDDEEVEVSTTRTGDGEERGANDRQEFTMGTMLRSMNIDFDIIGYDEDAGWWRDG
ncbi:DNA repair protein Dds20/Mei5 [Colletotrichum higginsianum]|nr:DNA repair protein Dds20/Mei5 [Colletotrichum higginsianum]